MRNDRNTTHNTGIASGEVKWKLGFLGFYQSLVIFGNIVLPNPPGYQAHKRYDKVHPT